MKRPNFFVSGAPRCGTSALYAYLSEHPNIFMSEVKELNYFASDFPNVQKINFKTPDDYLKVFANADDQHLAVGEASPFYLFSKVAFENMKAFDPDARIIISLRNPVDFVQSYHQLNLSLLREDEPDLARAWELQDRRRGGQNLPKSAREPELLMYGEIGQFGKHIQRLFSIFPREQVKVILLENLAADTQAVYEDILNFLDVPSDGRTDFQKVNANFENKSQFLAKLFHPPQPVYQFFMKTISLFGIGFMERVSVIYNRVERLNTKATSRPAMDPTLRAQLSEYFRPDIELLSELIEQDLSAWLVTESG
jgi:hypothetical protein